MAVPAPTYRHETAFLECGYSRIAGVDEAGRGALAGPLVAAAVILNPERIGRLGPLVRDSKTLSARQRSTALGHICESAISVAVGIVEAGEIDLIGLGPANRIAFERAVHNLSVDVDCLLCDAFLMEHSAPQIGLIDGDALCLSIAAASIVAKVTRDRFMRELDDRFAIYGFAQHAGYGTARHLEALDSHGPCHEHRRSFAPVQASVARFRP
jgi:ribonuclease HII